MASLVYPAVNAALQAPRVARVLGQGAALGYRAFKARKTIGSVAGAVTTAADMVRRYRKRKVARSRGRRFRRNIRPNSGGKVIGQYAQRTGRSYRSRRRLPKFSRKVQSVLFKQLPTQSLLSTNVQGTADPGTAIMLGANSHQSYTYVGMFGCINLPSNNGSPEVTQDSDLWNMYKQWWASHSNVHGDVDNERIFNSFQMYVMNCGVTIDFHYIPSEQVEGPVEVTFYVIKPRKSQRSRDKANAGSVNNFLDKFANYFNEDYSWETSTGVPAFNQINPITTYGSSPLDSRSFCKEWKIVSEKSIIVQPDNASYPN